MRGWPFSLPLADLDAIPDDAPAMKAVADETAATVFPK
jgi:hypothetical protein